MQLRFGTVWAQMKGGQSGSLGEILLSEEETISRIRFWTSISNTAAVEFTTSGGNGHGPWGGSGGEPETLQVGLTFSLTKK